MTLKATSHQNLTEIASQHWDLLEARPPATLMMSRDWVTTAFETVDADSEPFLVAARDGAQLVGLLPLARRQGERAPVLEFAGAPHHDLTDLLALPGREAEAAEAVLGFLKEVDDAEIDLDDIDPTGVLASSDSDGIVDWRASSSTSVLDLREAWECRVSKRRRKRLNKDMRRLRESHRVEIEQVKGRAVVAALPGFVARRRLHLEARGRPLDQPPVPLLEGVVSRLAPTGRCALVELRVDGVTAAADLLLLDRPVAMSWVCLLEADWRQYSCGNLLLRETALMLRAEGYELLDLGRGDEPYKFEMGAGGGTLLRATRLRPERR